MSPDEIRARIAELLRVEPGRVQDHVAIRDVVRDSVAVVELLVDLEQELGVILRQADLVETDTFGQLIALLHRRSSEVA